MGRKYCSVLTCNSSTDSHTGAFHKVPVDLITKLRWQQFLSVANQGLEWKLTDNSYVCSNHFTPDSYSRTSNPKQPKLINGSSPSVFNHHAKAHNIENGPELHMEKEANLKKLVSDLEHKLSEANVRLQAMDQEFRTVKSKYLEVLAELKVLRQNSKRKEEMISKKRSFISEMKTEIKDLKKRKLTVTAVESINPNECSTVPLELIQEILKKRDDSPKVKFPELLREFSFQLHYFSPRAYNFVRESLKNVLPHP